MSTIEFPAATSAELNDIYKLATEWLTDNGEIFAPTGGIIGSYKGLSIVNDKNSQPPVEYHYGARAEVINAVLPGAMELLDKDGREFGFDYVPAYFYLAEAGIHYKPGALGTTTDNYDPAKPHSHWRMIRLTQGGAPGLPTNVCVERQETSTMDDLDLSAVEEKPGPNPEVNFLSGAEAIALYGIAQRLDAIREEDYRQRRLQHQIPFGP